MANGFKLRRISHYKFFFFVPSAFISSDDEVRLSCETVEESLHLEYCSRCHSIAIEPGYRVKNPVRKKKRSAENGNVTKTTIATFDDGKNNFFTS